MKKELLVPVGNYLSLIAAINNGADAVYLAGKKYGARAYSDNFTLEELDKAVKTCHLYGVKIYITVNTLIYEKEIKEAIDYIDYLHKIGVDAVIMQDIGLINLVHNMFPNLEIHASTQMHNHAKENIDFLENLGVKRVVFARELSLDFINNLETSMEKEAFIQGSLCVSYSGQCYFSKCILDRSANRGMCAGMCRLKYEAYEDDKKIETNGDYLLSPKDLCSVKKFKEIMDSNIISLKIEGRMKSPSYVAIITKIYRKLIDDYYQGKDLIVSDNDMELLKSIFYREYTEGNLFNKDNIMNIKSSNHIGLLSGKVTNITNKKIEITLSKELKQGQSIRFKESDIGITLNFIYDKNNNLISKGLPNTKIYIDNFIKVKLNEEVYLTNPNLSDEITITKKIPIQMKFTAETGAAMIIEVSDGINKVEKKSSAAEPAKTSPSSSEQVKKNLIKTGNTPFVVDELKIILDDNQFIQNSILNNLRREALDELKEIRENKKVEYLKKEFITEDIICPKEKGIFVLARTKEQIEALKKYPVNIIVDNEKYLEESFIYKVNRNSLSYNLKHDKLLNTSYASMVKNPSLIGDYFLNITNHYALDVALKYNRIVTLSIENELEDIKDITKNYQNVNAAVYIYGRIELMMMKNCLIKNIKKESHCHACMQNKKYTLKDRNKAIYPVITNPLYHTSYILHNKVTDKIDQINTYQNIGINNFRLDLFDETYEDTINLMERLFSIYK